MTPRSIIVPVLLSSLAISGMHPGRARADGDLKKVNHIVFMMQENRSFDNYFGALPYVPGGPYHPCGKRNRRGENDHQCVDGLTCQPGVDGELACSNFNLNSQGEKVFAFHNRRICGRSGLDHGWTASHHEANWVHPQNTYRASPNDGFVRQNESDNPNQDVNPETIGFFTQEELPFYYALAQTFAIDDHYHASVIGPTLPNRLYFMAATSFGHTTTGEAIPPIPRGYRPITGTLLDLMDQHQVSWMSYFSDLPATAYLRPVLKHVAPVSQFASDLAAGHLSDVTYVDADFGILNPATESDEAPPNSIRKGQFFVAQNVAAIRNSQFWNDTIIVITYDEHGGCYDHVRPPHARQHGRRTPDGIAPGQCADLSSPPASEERGGGAQCSQSMDDAASTCPGFTPTGRYPASCPNFNQYGFRVPFTVVSPFAKPHYVSHTLGDHTSLVALVEKRFLADGSPGRGYPTLTERDASADTLEDLFDFDHSPSLNATIPTAPPPSSADEGCGGSPSGAFLSAP